MSLNKYFENLWWRKKAPPLPLILVEKLYQTGRHIHQAWRQRHQTHAPIPVISVGNITVGGSGKTPFTLWLYQQLIQRSYTPVILSRGYGGTSRESQWLDANSTPELVGDEPCMLYRDTQGLIISGANRSDSAAMASQKGDIIILDDGFQYRQLARDCDIVLVPDVGTGNGHELPAGPLREPLDQLQRADIVVRTGGKTESSVWQKKEWNFSALPDKPVQIAGKQTEKLDACVAVTAIARPERFMNHIREMNIRIQDTFIFPDHHPYSKQDVANIQAKDCPALVTAKDAVKIIPLWQSDLPLWELPLQFDAEEGLIDHIIQYIDAKDTHD